ncbi:hypothetical protein MNBD_GAMMA06-390, partial [hydrothermal vent metagenome]
SDSAESAGIGLTNIVYSDIVEDELVQVNI